MVELLGILVLIILLAPFVKAYKYTDIDRQQAMRRAMSKLQEKNRRISL
jgi:hypothetical protein